MERDPRAEADRIVQRAGHVIVYLPDPAGDHVAYTVGLSERPGRDHELVLTGQLLHTAKSVLNQTVDVLILDGLDPREGLLVDGILAGYAVQFRRVTDARPFAGMRYRLRGRQPVVWQVLLPDKNGLFPGARGYHTAFQQPLF